MQTLQSKWNGWAPGVRRFLRKPWHEKMEALRFRWSKELAKVPELIRLPFGAWWVLRNDHFAAPIRGGMFESAELAFAGRCLRAGMTMLDVGAHHGMYTLLASKRVGRDGKVICFEPSPREKRALRLHVAINGCRNVEIQGEALGKENTEASLFVVRGSQTGCNSLRPPVVESSTAPVRVRVMRLDDWLVGHQVERVDFIKVDVEGGELDFFKGASKLLRQVQAPVILCELQDIRARAWGHTAREAADFVRDFGYKWFRPREDGTLEAMPESAESYEGNFVAVPQPKLRELKEMIRNGAAVPSERTEEFQ